MGQNAPTGKDQGKITEYLLCPECSKKIPKFRVFVENSIAKLAINCECNNMYNYKGNMKMGEYLTKINNIDLSMMICPNHNKPQTKFCAKCEKWLCDKCSKKDHCQQKEDKSGKPAEVRCKLHQEPSKYYCNNCKIFLCESCKEEHSKNSEDESNQHEVVIYADLLKQEWLDQKLNLFIKITQNSENYRELDYQNIDKHINNYLTKNPSPEEKTKFLTILKRMHDKAELNKEACRHIELFYSRLLNGLYIGKEKSPYFAKENMVYNIIVNSTFTEEVNEKIAERLANMEKFKSRFDEDPRVLEEYSLKFIEYLSSTFLMFSLKNDLFLVSANIKTNSEITAICIIDEQKVAVAADSIINVYNLENGIIQSSLKGHFNEVTALTKLNKSTLLSASLDKTFKIWNLDKKNLINSINLDAVVANIFISPEGENNLCIAYYFTKFERVNLFNNQQLKVLASRPTKENENFEVFHQLSDGNIVCGAKNLISIYDEKTIEVIKSFNKFEGCPLCFCELENQVICAGLNNGNIIIFDNAGNDYKLIGHKSGVTGLQVLKSHNYILVSTSLDSKIKFWNLRTNTCQETFIMEKKELTFFVKFESGKMGLASDKEFSAWQGYSYNSK